MDIGTHGASSRMLNWLYLRTEVLAQTASFLKDFSYELYPFAQSFLYLSIKHLLGPYLLCALQLSQLVTDMDSSLDFCDLRLAITQVSVRGH